MRRAPFQPARACPGTPRSSSLWTPPGGLRRRLPLRAAAAAAARSRSRCCSPGLGATTRAVRPPSEPHGQLSRTRSRHDLPRRRRRRRPPVLRQGVTARPSLAERYKRERFAVEDALRTGIPWPAPSRPLTPPASCTATSSPRTCSRTTTVAGAHRLRHSLEPRGELPVHTVTSPTTPRRRRRGSPADRHERALVARPRCSRTIPRPTSAATVFSLARRATAARRPHAFEIPGRPNGSLDLDRPHRRGAITPDRPDRRARAASPRCSRRQWRLRRDDRYPRRDRSFHARPQRSSSSSATRRRHRGRQPRVAERHDPAGDDARCHARPRRARRSTRSAARPTARSRDATPPRARTAALGGGAPAPDDGTVLRPAAPAARTCGPSRRPVDATRGPAIPPGRRHPRRRPSTPTQIAPEGGAARCPGCRMPVGRRRRTVARSRSSVGRIVGIAAGLVVLAAIGIAVRPLRHAAAGAGRSHRRAGRPGRDPRRDGSRARRGGGRAVGRRRERELPGVASERRGRRPLSLAPCRRLGVDRGGRRTGDRRRGRELGGAGVCIEVQVQRGSKTSEPVTGCTP
jgi:hypothetical protein